MHERTNRDALALSALACTAYVTYRAQAEFSA